MSKQFYTVQIGSDLYDVPSQDLEIVLRDYKDKGAKLLNTTAIQLGNDIYDVPDSDVQTVLTDYKDKGARIYNPFGEESKSQPKNNHSDVIQEIMGDMSFKPNPVYVESTAGSIEAIKEQEPDIRNRRIERERQKTLSNIEADYQKFYKETGGNRAEYESRVSEAEAELDRVRQQTYNYANRSWRIPVLDSIQASFTYGAVNSTIGLIASLFEGQEELYEASFSQKLKAVGDGLRQAIAENEGIAGEVVATIAEMVPTMIITRGTAGVAMKTGMSVRTASTIGSGVGFIAPVADQKYRELARRTDLDESEKRINAGLTGLVAGVTERFGSVANMNRLTAVMGKAWTKSKLSPAFFERTAKPILLGTGQEFTEEVGETWLEYLVNGLTIGDDREVEEVFYDSLKSGLIGGISGGVISTNFAMQANAQRKGKIEIKIDEISTGFLVDEKKYHENPKGMETLALSFIRGERANPKDYGLSETDYMIDSEHFEAIQKNEKNIKYNSDRAKYYAEEIIAVFNNQGYANNPKRAFEEIDHVLKNYEGMIDEKTALQMTVHKKGEVLELAKKWRGF